MRIMSVVVALVGPTILAGACGSSPQITAPTPIVSTATPVAPATVGPGVYMVTIKVVGDDGPNFCIWTPPVGATFQGPYTLAWNGDTVAFVPPDPIDWDSFTAHVNGLNFAGSNPPVGSGAGMCAHYGQSSTIAGAFSPDQSSFTATETLSFTLDSGQVKTITFAWSGNGAPVVTR